MVMTVQRGRPSRNGRIELHDREERLLEMWGARTTYAEIARQEGYNSPQAAHRAVHRALKRFQAPQAEARRQQDSAECDRITREAWKIVETVHYRVDHGHIVKDENGNPLVDDDPIRRALETVLHAQKRRAEVWGSDAPAPQRPMELDYETLIAHLQYWRSQRQAAEDAVAGDTSEAVPAISVGSVIDADVVDD